MLSANDRRSEILELQNMLRIISQADGSIPLINPDGIFGQAMENAVLAFQKNLGLPPNGIVDFMTWDAIFRAYMNASRIVSLRSIQPFPAGNYEIRPDERSDIVYIIQFMLSALSVALDIFDDIEPTGVYDKKTENAITEFQKLNGLTPNGIIDRNTWDALARQYNQIAGNSLYSD